MRTKLIPFDLEKANSGAKVVTRQGYPARLLCGNLKSPSLSVVAAVLDKDGLEGVSQYTAKGYFHLDGSTCPEDLMLEVEVPEEWIYLMKITGGPVFYHTSILTYPTEEEAIKEGRSAEFENMTFLKAVRVDE